MIRSERSPHASARARRSVMGAVVVAMVVAVGAVVPAQAASTAQGGFGSVVPSRLLDTRVGLGVVRGSVAAGGTVHLPVAGRGGVPSSGVSAVVLNVTVTAPTGAGFLTVYGDQGARPGTSNLNFVAGQTVSNLVIAQVGADGGVAVDNASTGNVHLIADVSGWVSNTTDVPGPITDVAATPGATSISLSWTDPNALSFAGVMIRRALGSTPPASAVMGTLVADLAAPAISLTDTGLRSGTVYSYALFAHNATPAYASAATAVSTTFAAGTGAVSGTVSEAGGTHHGLMNVNVQVHSPSTSHTYGALTKADGSYAVSVPVGTDYQVCFDGFFATGGAADALGYVSQCHHTQPRLGTPTPVSVTEGTTITNIDGALTVAGAISGTAADAGGTHHGLANVGVSVTSRSGFAGISVRTAADGSYSLPGLDTNTDYQVCFYASGATGGTSDSHGYVDQCYDTQTFTSPTPVSVTAGRATAGINAALVGNP